MIWNFDKTHFLAWKLGKTHAIEVQLDYWKDLPLFSIDIDKHSRGQDHPGVRIAVNVFRWELAIDYYSTLHAADID